MASTDKAQARKKGHGRQYAAMPLMTKDGQTQVLLVTSRETKRWVLPKGWAEDDLTPHELAAKEAYEEAGVTGDVVPEPIGTYHYQKKLEGGQIAACEVGVYPLWVKKQLKNWPERKERESQWFTFSQAALVVDEGELVTLLLELAAQEDTAD
ncbi:NUDIX hydrolase [Acetobacteraceae bacterium H6797]|nr:NUDIX hydrolase [Acetobacteraceae bacterium H6797]